MNKKFIHVAAGLFLGVEALIVCLHSFAFGQGFHSDWSISRYMGLTFWSAIVFAIFNFAIIAIVLKYMLKVRKMHHLSIIWLLGVLVMMTAYAGLSFCPIGLFDAKWGEFGIVSNFHHTFSTTLFIAMAVVALDTMIEIRKGKAMHIYGLCLLAFAGFCTYGFTCAVPAFWGAVFFFESGYIFANLLFYSLIPKKI